jgi:hypothetical protein
MLPSYPLLISQREKAVRRFVFAEAPEDLASALSAVEPAHRSRLLTLGVLEFLAAENLRDANTLVDRVAEGLNDSLVAFCRCLVQTCERDAAPLFQLLTEKAFKRHLAGLGFEPLLVKVGQRFFKISPPPNLLNSVLSMLAA